MKPEPARRVFPTRFHAVLPPRLPGRELAAAIAWSALAGIAVGVVVALAVALDSRLLLASAAASIVAVAAEPAAPSTQARVIIFGYLVAACVGTLTSLLVADGGRQVHAFDIVSAVIAVAITSVIMLVYRRVHPPAAGIAAAIGATPLIGWDLVVFATALATVLAVAVVIRRRTL